MTDFPCLICMCKLNIEKNEHYIKFYCNQCKISKKYYDSLENEAYEKFVKYCETRRKEIESDFSKNKEKKKRDEDYENVFRLFNPYRADDDFIPPVKNSTKPITPEILDDLGIKKIIPSQTYEDVRKIIGDIEIDTFLENILFSGDAFVCSVDSFNPENAEFDSSLDVLGKLSSNLKLILKEHGINNLYRYQKQTFKTILEQKDVFITAPTSSGKTESFLIPILQKIINDGTKNQVETIIVYPTKALADDQLKRLKKYCDSCGIKVENIHGDVSSAERKKIYSNPPQILLTNFDMIHYHLWNNDDFAKLISTAKILAIDEVHKYGGIFGSNVHNIIKRLKRICGILQIIAASATLENPENFCEKLFGNKFQIIQGSGNRGKIIFCMLYPLKKSQNEMMISLISKLANQDHKILSFSNSRMGAEEISIGCKKNGISIEVHRVEF